MKRKGAKLKPKMFSLGDVHQNVIDRFIDIKGFTSESDVVRQALLYFHDKVFPNYIYMEKSAAGELKRRTIEEERAFKAIPDEEYCLTTIKGKIVDAKDGFRYCLYHNIGNSLRAVRIDKAKQLVSEDPDFLSIHLGILEDKTIDEALKTQKTALENQYGIIFPE